MDFSGSDLLYFLEGILEDFKDLGNADLLSLGVRVLVVFFGVIILLSFFKILWRIFWDTFGGLFYILGRIITAPYRMPRNFLRRIWFKIRSKRDRRRYQKEQEIIQKNRIREEAEKKKREAEMFERIMK